MIVRPRGLLRPKQHFIAQLGYDRDNVMVISGMGSGKTGGALTAIRRLHDSFTVRHTLILAPLLVARETWPTEFEQWAHSRALTYAVASHDNPRKRAEAIEQRAQVTILNFELLQWLARHLGTVENWYWDHVVVDESSRFKAGESRTKRVKYKDAKGRRRMRKGGKQTRFGIIQVARKKIKRTMLLTGTPFPLGIIDAWGQSYVMDGGQRLGDTKDKFKDRWFDENKFSHEIKPKPGAEQEILSLIDDLMVTLPDEKLVDAPIDIPVYVDLSPKVMKEYRAFERTLYSEEYGVEAANRGVLFNKLLQFASGSMYREDRSVVEVHDLKLKAFEELRQQAAGENILLFYQFQFDLERLKKKYPWGVVASEEDRVVQKWNDGRIPLLFAHPATLGHGTNMQYGGHIAVWFGPTTNNELFEQGSWRLPRPGQEHQVLNYIICARGTHDERALADNTRKSENQERYKAHFAVDIN